MYIISTITRPSLWAGTLTAHAIFGWAGTKGGPPSGFALPAILRVQTLKTILLRFGKKGIYKTHQEVGFKQVMERHDGGSMSRRWRETLRREEAYELEGRMH
jgi:hypothetical protein